MFGIFKNTKPVQNPIRVDIHSHLLPGLDDGVTSFEESYEIIKNFEERGYKKIITTPHIMSDFYRNTPDIISTKLTELNTFINGRSSVILEAAAEYYLDETFVELLSSGSSSLLTIGKKYILFETSFVSEPIYLKEAIFKMQSNGLKPILAHPERYQYLINDWELACDIFERGTLFQININSIQGYYSRAVQKMAMKLIKNEMVSFVGSDCHNISHFEALSNTLNTKNYEKLVKLKLLNNTLLQ